VTYAAKLSELPASEACASKRQGAGGNIGGRRRAVLAQVFDHFSWRCAGCGAIDDLTIDHLAGRNWGWWPTLNSRTPVPPLAGQQWLPWRIPDALPSLQREQA
jgi:hypothetical protein